MTPKTLVPRVINEVKKLKKNATSEELLRLDFDRLDPEHKNKCIYGQLTDDCFSPRAHELINQCAERMYKQNNKDNEFSASFLNGKPKLENDDRNGRFSPIECFITFRDNETNGNNRMIINYLQGKTTRLKFKPFSK